MEPGLSRRKIAAYHKKCLLICFISLLGWFLCSAMTAMSAESGYSYRQTKTEDKGYCAQMTSDGGYIIASYCITQRGDKDLYLLKTDSQGKKEWEKICGGDQDDQANWVIETKEKNFVVCGFTQSKQGKGKDIYLLKVDQRGQIAWGKNYGGRLKEEKTEDKKTQKDYDLGFEVFDYNSSSGLSREYYDVFLLRDDKGSDDENQKSEYTEDEGNFVQATSDGGYIIAGYSRPQGKPADLCLVKVDFQGILLWARTIGSGQDEEANAIQQTQDGGYIVAGYTRSVGLGSRPRIQNQEQKEREDKDIYLVKTDSRGYPQWEQTFGGPKDDAAHSVLLDSGGGYVVCGYTAQSSGTGTNLYLLKTSSDGDLVWQIDNWGGKGSACGTCVKQLTDGGYLVTGNTWTAQAGTREIFLIRSNSKGKFMWDREWKSGGEVTSGQVQIMPVRNYAVMGQVLIYNPQHKKVQSNPVLLQYGENGRLIQDLIIYDNLLTRERGQDIPAATNVNTSDIPPVPQDKGARNSIGQ